MVIPNSPAYVVSLSAIRRQIARDHREVYHGGACQIRGRKMRSIIASVVLGLSLALPASATTFTTDASDLWSNLSEQGWGVNVIQQNDILFITFFVYSPSGAPIWYVGSATSYVGQQGNSLVYSGPLYQTSGPWFGGPFNPANVGNRQVGTVTFTLDTITTATIFYSVDGVSVTKPVTRQTWRMDNLSGSYLGASIGTYSSGCPSSGYAEEPATISISQNGASFSMASQFITNGVSCNYSGTYQQDGRMGSVSGTFSCNNGFAGQFQAFEMEASPQGVTARAAVQGGACSWSGRIGGLRRGG